MLLKVEGLRSTERAMQLLDTDEHLWVLGIGNVLIYVCKIGEATYRMSICSVEKIAARFSVKRMAVDAKVNKNEAYQLVKKLGARPCKVVNNRQVDETLILKKTCENQLSYQNYLDIVQSQGLQVQVNP